jgi:hypothetical protein
VLTSDRCLVTRELEKPAQETKQMTAGEVSPSGAVSREPLEWHSLPWKAIQRNVRRLQARIVKATQEGRWGKVKALQRLLTHSFSGRALAVRRVTENQGRNTPGVDGEIYIRIATGGFTAWESLWGNRVLLSKAFERLEPCDGRLSRTVLRGLGGSNAPRLPGAALRGAGEAQAVGPSSTTL